MARPIVYGPAGSTYVWSTRLALAEKGVAHELVDVPFGAHREEPHLSRHPFGKVPAFEHDGFALYETQAILRYIDEGFPVAPLQPTDLHQFARMNQIMGIVDAYAWRFDRRRDRVQPPAGAAARVAGRRGGGRQGAAAAPGSACPSSRG